MKKISIKEYNQLKHDQDVLNKIRAYERKRISKMKSIDIRIKPDEHQAISDYVEAAGISVRQLVFIALKESYGIEY